MSNKGQVSDEIKHTLISEKEKQSDKVFRTIKRQILFKRYVLVLFFQLLVLIPFFWIFSYTMPPTSTSPSVLFSSMIAYVIAIYGIFFWQNRRMFHRRCKILCLYSAVSAADALDRNDVVEGSFYVTRLLNFIKPFAESEKIKIGCFPTDVKSAFLGKIEKLTEQSSAVGKAILGNSGLRTDFSNQLYLLANSLFLRDKAPDLNMGVKSLDFLFEKSKPYFESITYLQSHKRLNMATKILSEIGKLALVPILLFILWFLFGYKG